MENEKQDAPDKFAGTPMEYSDHSYTYSFGFEVGYSPNGLFARFKKERSRHNENRPGGCVGGVMVKAGERKNA